MKFWLQGLIPAKNGWVKIDKYLFVNIFIALVLIAYVFSRFSFGHGLLHGCIPADYYMIDHKNRTFEVGELVAFTMPMDVPFIKKGATVVKIVAGKGGDKIKVTMQGVYNGDRFFPTDAERISKKYKIPKESIERVITVPDGDMFLVGQTDYSYDSRFWGTIKSNSVIGKTYAIY